MAAIAPSRVFDELIEKRQAIIVLLDREVVEQKNFQKLADHVAYQARFEFKLVFPILLEPCQWQDSSLKYIPVYPLNQKPISEWESDETAWQQLSEEIWTVLKPYSSFYPESPRLTALRSIGKVSVGSGQNFVSGFLINSNPDLLLTSTLLINSEEKAREGQVTFTDAGELSASFKLQPERFFLMDAETGVALVSVAENPLHSNYRTPRTIADYYTLKLASEQVIPGDLLDATNFERAQKLSTNQQTVEFADQEHIQYRALPVPGASGGPLLNEHFEVVAMNPAGRERADYEMLKYDRQTRTIAEFSATVPTLKSLFQEIMARRPDENWVDSYGKTVLPNTLYASSSPWQGQTSKEYDDPNEVITDIHQNRTLLVQKLTADLPVKPIVVEGLETVQEVLDYFRPEVEIEFQGQNGPIKETLQFSNLTDFGKGITALSPFLRGLNSQQEDLQKLSTQLRSNRILQKVLTDPVAKRAYLTVLRTMAQEIEEADPTTSVAFTDFQEQVKIENPAQQLTQSAEQLAKFGGLQFMEATIDGVQNLNPDRKARKAMFLFETDNEPERKKLKKRLDLYVDLLQNDESIASILNQVQNRKEATDEPLRHSLKQALDATRELEIAYRSTALFYQNAGPEKIRNISIVNADPEQIMDLDNPLFFDGIAEELREYYDRLDLRNNYSLLIVPGYLGSKRVVNKWARLAHETRVLLLTDYRDLDTPDDVLQLWKEEDIPGTETYKANVVMTCNYLVGREAFLELGEEVRLFVPPSTALAGKIYRTMIEQTMGRSAHNMLSEVDDVRFSMRKQEVSHLEEMGLVPIIRSFGEVVAFSSTTLYKGDNRGLRIYSVVRLFDWLIKMLVNFMNRRVFINWDSRIGQELREHLEKFLLSITGSDKIIEGYEISHFGPDPTTKIRRHLIITVKLHSPNESFRIHLDGKMDDGENKWLAAVDPA